MGAEVVVGGMIAAVDYDVAQELANVNGTDCRAKHGSPPDNVVVDGQSYVPVLPLAPSSRPLLPCPWPTWPSWRTGRGELPWRSIDVWGDTAHAVPSS
jgi:hypothetical protein